MPELLIFLKMKPRKLSWIFSSSTIVLFGGAIIALIDQFFKHKIRLNDGFYVCNKGISFSLPFSSFLFWLILSFFLIAGFVYFQYLLKKGLLTPYYLFAFGLLWGGIVSNCLDRLLFGCIFDYIFPFWKSLPVFNLADVAIFLGSCLFLFLISTNNSSRGVQPVDK